MKHAFSICLCLLLCAARVPAQTVLPLWPGTPPNALRNDTARERTWRDNILRINTVTTPTLTAYLPVSRRNTGTAVMICPGGAYGFLAFEVEGTQVAQWLASQGIAAFVLKYRLPDARLMTRQHEVPLADALQGLALIRKNAARWHLHPGRIGIMGFSAGGHLAATVSTHYYRTKNADSTDSKPHFAVLVYPVITTGPATHQGSIDNLLGGHAPDSLRLAFSNERQVTPHTPPTLLLHPTPDATVPVENSVLYYSALVQAGVPAEMHLYGDGGHGFGMSRPEPPNAAYGHWREQLLCWLENRGLWQRQTKDTRPRK